MAIWRMCVQPNKLFARFVTSNFQETNLTYKQAWELCRDIGGIECANKQMASACESPERFELDLKSIAGCHSKERAEEWRKKLSEPRIEFYFDGDALTTNADICESKVMSAECIRHYGARYMVGESMTRKTAQAIVDAFGGILREYDKHAQPLEPHVRGYQEALRGISDPNPYPEGSPEAAQWKAGQEAAAIAMIDGGE